MGLPAHRAAALCVLVLGVYLQVVEWVDLFPWNDVRQGNGQETLDIALAAATGVLVGALWMSRRWAPLLAAWALSMWAWLQVVTWWPPYFSGASPGWRDTHARWFGETVHILPRDDLHLPPDANHITLQVLIVVALAACLNAAWRGFAEPEIAMRRADPA